MVSTSSPPLPPLPSPPSAAQFVRRLVVVRCSLGFVQKLCCVLNSIDAHCMCQRKLHSVKLLTHMDQCSRLPLNLPDRSLDNCMCRRSGSATPLEDHMNWPTTTSETTLTTVKHSQMVTSRSTEDSWHASDTCHKIHHISFLRQCKHALRWQTR